MGVLPGNLNRFPYKLWGQLTSHSWAVVSGNLTWVEIRRNWWWAWVCACGLDCKRNHRMVYHCYSSLLQSCSPKCVISLWLEDLETGDLSPSLSPCFPFFFMGQLAIRPERNSVGLDRITVAKCSAAGTQDVGEKIRDSPRHPGGRESAPWLEQISRHSGRPLFAFHFPIWRITVFLRCAQRITGTSFMIHCDDTEYQCSQGPFVWTLHIILVLLNWKDMWVYHLC